MEIEEIIVIVVIVIIVLVLVIVLLVRFESPKSNVALGERCKEGECAAGLECQESICKAKVGSSCQTNSQCVSESQGCLDGICVAKIMMVGEDCSQFPCDNGLVCDNNVCVDPNEETSESTTEETQMEETTEDEAEITCNDCSYYMKNGRVMCKKNNISRTVRCDSSNRDIKSPKKICKYMGVIYLHCGGSMFEVEIINDCRWLCHEVDWIPKSIIYVDTTDDHKTLWIQSRYMYNSSKVKGSLYHMGKLLSTYSIAKGRKRIYMSGISDYEDVEM